MNPFFAGIATTLSRTLARHQGRPLRDARRLPLWRLLAGEVAYLGARALRPPWRWVWVSVVLAAAGVMVGFAEGTPGPVISFGWRIALAIGAATVVAVAVRRWPYRRNG